MKYFLERYKYYEGDNPDLIVYAAELRNSKELTPDLLERYDDNLEFLEEELEEQNRSYVQNRTEHERLFELGLFDNNS